MTAENDLDCKIFCCKGILRCCWRASVDMVKQSPNTLFISELVKHTTLSASLFTIGLIMDISGVSPRRHFTENSVSLELHQGDCAVYLKKRSHGLYALLFRKATLKVGLAYALFILRFPPKARWGGNDSKNFRTYKRSHIYAAFSLDLSLSSELIESPLMIDVVRKATHSCSRLMLFLSKKGTLDAKSRSICEPNFHVKCLQKLKRCSYDNNLYEKEVHNTRTSRWSR